MASSFRATGAQASSPVTRNTCSPARQRSVAVSFTRISPVKPRVDHPGTVQRNPSSPATGVPSVPLSTVKSDAASASTATASPSSSRKRTSTSTRQPFAALFPTERARDRSFAAPPPPSPPGTVPVRSESSVVVVAAAGAATASPDAAPAISPAIARSSNAYVVPFESPVTVCSVVSPVAPAMAVHSPQSGAESSPPAMSTAP